MLTKNQLKEIFSKYDFRPLKRLGENYLVDANIKDKIISQARVDSQDVVLEIGSGLGALTIDLAESGATVFAVEKDKKACAILRELIGKKYPKVTLFCEDILKFDLRKAYLGRKIKIIGNLPYYITTPVIEYLIANRALIESALVMVQREVANRLLGSCGTKDYSSISCYVQYHTKPSYIYTVKRTSFWPSPDVDSSIVRFDMLDEPPVSVKDEELLFKVIRGSFNQRRKSILNSLSRKEILNIPKEVLSKVLKDIGIDPALRPERLSIYQFAQIADAVSKQN